MAPACAPTWHPRAYFGTPLTRFAPPRELHVWPKRVRPLGVPAPIKAHPSHVSCPPGGSTYGPSGCVHSVPAPFSAHLSHISCSPGSPTCGSIECVHIASLRQFRHTHPTRVVPHPRELYPWPPRVRPHGVPAPMSAHPSHVSCPSGSSTHGPNGCAHMASPRPSRHTLTSLVPLQGAPGNKIQKDTQRTEEVRTRSPEPNRAHPSRISHPTGSPSFGHSAGNPPGTPSMIPEQEPPQRRDC